MGLETKITEQIEKLGMPPPRSGESNDTAFTKVLDALVILEDAVLELSELTDRAVLLTSKNEYLRRLGELK